MYILKEKQSVIFAALWPDFNGVFALTILKEQY